MRRPERLLPALLLLFLAAAPAPAKDRDPEYDRILAAYKAERWPELDRRAPAFLEAKPDYEFAHSVRFMIADSLHRQKRLPEAIDAYREYLRHHPDATLAGRARLGLVRALNEDRRYDAALAAAEEALEAEPGHDEHSYQRALALEGLRRFEEAAEAYAAISGERAETAAYRLGVARFRGRDFEGARMALEAFLARHPESSFQRSARDYLFRTDTGFSDVRDGIVFDYEGKYRDDPRFLAIRDRIRALRASALAELSATLGIPEPEGFLLRFADAGSDRSGNFAKTRLEVVGGEPRQVVILLTEYLVMDAHDPERTLVHEFHHCLQRESLGEEHFLAPKWVREGAALYVAGQGESRSRLLAVELGRRTNVADPLDRLVNGLSGRHTFTDYAEDVAAFEAVEERHGRKKALALVRRLLETTDFEAAIREVLDEDFATFEKAASERARQVLDPLVGPGRKQLVEARRRLASGDPDGALETLPEDPGAYGPAVSWVRAEALLAADRPEEALRVAREFLSEYRRFPTMLDNVLRVEVKALRALDAEEAGETEARARKDLTPCGGL